MFGQDFPITQLASSISLGVASVMVGPAAGSNSVVLAVYPNTNAWTATANVGWLHLSPSSQSGTGSTNVFFSYDANLGTTRSGTLSIAGRALTVTQAGSTYVPAGPVTTLASGMPFADGAGVDRAGNVYFAVANQNAIKKWTATNNTVTTLVSSGIMYPTWVAVDGADNVYFNGGGIQKWSAVTHSVTTLTSSSPSEFALDAAGNIYFPSDNSIQVWTAGNQVVSTVVSGLNSPGKLAVDVAGNIYIDSPDGILKWTAANNSVAYLFSSGYDRIQGLAVDGEGNIYIPGQNSYFNQKGILKWTIANSTLSTLVSSGSAQFFGVAADVAGNLYFTDAYNGLLRELPNAFVDPSPKSESLIAGYDSLPTVLPSTINLLAPFVPSSDSTWLTITGVTNGVVSYAFTTNLTLTRTGHITLLGQSISVTQTGPAFTLGTSNLYEGPTAGSDSVVLAVTPNIGIWTATTNVPWLHLGPANLSGTGSTNVVFSFDANPGATRSGIVTIAGQILTITQAGSTYVGTGPLTALATLGLSGPSGVAVDVAGNVYIADTTNNLIEKWTATNNTLTTLVPSGLAHPAGVAVDIAGNIYIADTGNGAVKEWIAASNTVTTLVSSGLSSPAGVAVDVAGNVYIADTGNSAIKKWSMTNGAVATLASSGLSNPAGVAVDIAGNVYIADTGNNAIKKWIAANGTMTNLLSSGLSNPAGVAVDGSGNVCIADTGNSAIKKWITASNTVISLVSSGLFHPAGVAIDGTGNVYIADTDDNAVMELPRAFVDPTARQQIADPGIGNLPVVLPATENLLAPFIPTSDQPWLTIGGITNGVVSFSFTANVGSSRTAHLFLLGQTIAITQGGLTYSLGTTALLVGPTLGSNSVVLGVAPNIAAWTATANADWLHLGTANQSGTGSANLVFSYDANTNATRSGTLTIADRTLTVTQAGSTYVSAGLVGSLVSTGLSTPYGVAVDGSGNVYIADSLHNAIKKWSATNGAVTTLVSSGLATPTGVAVDGAGNVYMADTFNNAIKQWTATNGVVTTLVSSGLSYPNGVGVDGAGNVYIADTSHNAIKELPYAFVDPTSKLEGLAAGNDELPVVLPATANLLTPFAPTSDQSWLTIAGIANGVVRFGFTANPGPARTAHINLLGQTISITQGLIGTPPNLTGVKTLGNGVIQFSFTNNPSASFTVLTATNISLPLAQWTVVGSATNISSNLFQFTSQPTTNSQQRYYTVHSP
jgi:DNA-binding beta-propeller fold protein YncE